MPKTQFPSKLRKRIAREQGDRQRDDQNQSVSHRGSPPVTPPEIISPFETAAQPQSGNEHAGLRTQAPLFSRPSSWGRRNPFPSSLIDIHIELPCASFR